MPSPDVTPYVNLTLFDLDPQQIFDNALVSLQTSLPTWIPREGNIEMILLEAMALEASESVFAINRLPAAITEILLRLYGITRDVGSPPVADLTVTFNGSMGYAVPTGTSMRLTLPGGALPIVFSTTEEFVVAPGNSSVVISATGNRFTDDANNVDAGTALEMLDSIVFVETVVFGSVTSGGTDPETDADYFARAMARLSRLTDTLTLPSHFSNFALEDPIFQRALALDNWDGSGGVPGDDPGHITVAVYGPDRLNTSGEKSALAAAMSAISLANLQVHVIDPTINTEAVTATLRALPGYAAATVQASAVAALTAYLDPMTWNWDTVLRRFEVISLLDRVAGVNYVESLTIPASDVTLTGNAALVDAGTLTITVNEA